MARSSTGSHLRREWVLVLVTSTRTAITQLRPSRWSGQYQGPRLITGPSQVAPASGNRHSPVVTRPDIGAIRYPKTGVLGHKLGPEVVPPTEFLRKAFRGNPARLARAAGTTAIIHRLAPAGVLRSAAFRSNLVRRVVVVAVAAEVTGEKGVMTTKGAATAAQAAVGTHRPVTPTNPMLLSRKAKGPKGTRSPMRSEYLGFLGPAAFTPGSSRLTTR